MIKKHSECPHGVRHGHCLWDMRCGMVAGKPREGLRDFKLPQTSFPPEILLSLLQSEDPCSSFASSLWEVVGGQRGYVHLPSSPGWDEWETSHQGTAPVGLRSLLFPAKTFLRRWVWLERFPSVLFSVLQVLLVLSYTAWHQAVSANCPAGTRLVACTGQPECVCRDTWGKWRSLRPRVK